ncbi:uncharacterized protein [Henckelia pumila]|uniref:uncharacterized protein n=1 Tax=Henckelia pumila TaxID=405737 RepID=UPI003C6E7C1E
MSSLRTYELEMNFGKKDKGKSIALEVSNDSYNDFVDLTHGVNESDLGDDSIALLTKQFGNYLKRMRDYKKPGQKPKVLNTLAVGKPLRICGPEQTTIPSKSQNHFQKEGKTLTISKKFESVKCHECTGFGHYANECPTRLRKGMCAYLSDDEDEEGVTTLGHNTDQKVLCLNASVSGDSNQEAGEVEISWDNAQKMYEELYNDWILRNKSNSALTKENSELKASVARLEVVLSKKDLELGKVKEELGRANATLAKFNSSKTKLDSILMMEKDDRAGLGFHNSKFEVGESSQTVFVKENSNSASIPIAIPKEKPIPLKTQAPVQRKKQRKRRFVCHYCHKQGHIKPYCFKLRYDYMYWKTRQVLPSVLPTLNQNTVWKKNSEKKVWVPKAKSSCNVVYTYLKINVAGHWYFDSGSSRHMTGLKKYLSDYVEQDKGKVTYGGGANGKIVGKGTLNVEGLLKLHNSNSCVLTGSRSSDNCYQLGEELSCKFTKVDDLNLWHQKLGHANFKALKKLSQYDVVCGMPNLTSKVPYVCGDCQKGKQARVSHPVLQYCGTTRCLELLHMDLMGPMEVESCGGKRYSFVCVDEFSRYSWDIGIRTDHDKEFENSLFDQFCEKEGISHEYSAPKTHQQNGIAERKNRTLQEMARLAKFDSKSDKCLFLGYALNSRAYRLFKLRTRTIIESINVVFDDYADLKEKTIEDNIHDLLDDNTKSHLKNHPAQH